MKITKLLIKFFETFLEFIETDDYDRFHYDLNLDNELTQLEIHTLITEIVHKSLFTVTNTCKEVFSCEAVAGITNCIYEDGIVYVEYQADLVEIASLVQMQINKLKKEIQDT